MVGIPSISKIDKFSSTKKIIKKLIIIYFYFNNDGQASSF